jgi:hypothetical protein
VILYLSDLLNYVRIISLTVCVVSTMLKLLITVFSIQITMGKQVMSLRTALDFVSEIEADLPEAGDYASEVDAVRTSSELLAGDGNYDLAIHFQTERVFFVDLVECDYQPVVFERRSFHRNFVDIIEPERDQSLRIA